MLALGVFPDPEDGSHEEEVPAPAVALQPKAASPPPPAAGKGLKGEP